MGAFDRIAAADLYAEHPVPQWLLAARESARTTWLAAALPTRKTEAWKYTGIEALADVDWQTSREASDVRVDPRAARIDGLDADWLVFVDGRFSAALSEVDTGDRTLTRFADADASERAIIERHLGCGRAGAENPFVALGGCWTTDGALLHLPRGQRATRPVCIVHLASGVDRAFAQRALVVLEERAEAELIELFCVAPGADPRALVTGSTEIVLGSGASLSHRRLHLEGMEARHIGGVGVELGRAARYSGHVFAAGARLQRLDVRVRHTASGSEALLDGVYLARGAAHVDLHTTVEHAATHGTTHQVYRGLVDDAARAVFNGRILIERGAQKTSADLANRNLLFSDRAEVDTKPELEIYADDVKCSHGTTVSRVEEKSLYYLQSRGIARREAEVLLAVGFVNELLAAMNSEPLAALLRARLRAWFGLEAREELS